MDILVRLLLINTRIIIHVGQRRFVRDQALMMVLKIQNGGHL